MTLPFAREWRTQGLLVSPWFAAVKCRPGPGQQMGFAVATDVHGLRANGSPERNAAAAA